MYRADKWNSELLEALDSYSFLHDPVTCAGAMSEYYKKSNLIRDISVGTAIRHKEESGSEMSIEDIQAVKDKYTEEFSNQALQGILVYRRQMVVIASTICEAMLLDFLKNHFSSYPEQMYDYVSDDGRVNFRQVAKHGTREEMLNFFSSIAAKQFIGRKWKDVFKNLEKILKAKLLHIDLVYEMFLLRNEVIHEAAKPDVSNDKLYDYFDAVLGLNEELSDISKRV